MQINIKDITEGKYNGKYVYISDIRDNGNPFEKLIRNIPPQKVLVRCNKHLNKNKTIYYSESHFLGLNKNGEPLKSKVIAPYDNTGYRAFTGTPLKVFDNLKDCEESYNIQKEVIRNKMKEKIKVLQEKIENF